MNQNLLRKELHFYLRTLNLLQRVKEFRKTNDISQYIDNINNNLIKLQNEYVPSTEVYKVDIYEVIEKDLLDIEIQIISMRAVGKHRQIAELGMKNIDVQVEKDKLKIS